MTRSHTTAFAGILFLVMSFMSASLAMDERHHAAESMFGSSHLPEILMSMSRGWHECRIVHDATTATAMNHCLNRTFAKIVGRMVQERTTDERKTTRPGNRTPGSDEHHP
jgi:hypothetical protein